MAKEKNCTLMPFWILILNRTSQLLLTVNASLGPVVYCVMSIDFRHELCNLSKNLAIWWQKVTSRRRIRRSSYLTMLSNCSNNQNNLLQPPNFMQMVQISSNQESSNMKEDMSSSSDNQQQQMSVSLNVSSDPAGNSPVLFQLPGLEPGQGMTPGKYNNNNNLGVANLAKMTKDSWKNSQFFRGRSASVKACNLKETSISNSRSFHSFRGHKARVVTIPMEDLAVKKQCQIAQV